MYIFYKIKSSSVYTKIIALLLIFSLFFLFCQLLFEAFALYYGVL